MTVSTLPYLTLKADERQELRLPGLLKDHLAQVAARHGQSVSEYVVRLVAVDVSAEMAKSLEWQLTAPEFLEFMKAVVAPAPETEAMTEARMHAALLFRPTTIPGR